MLSDFSVNAVYAANFILVPLAYETDALEGIQDLFNFINEIKEKYPKLKIIVLSSISDSISIQKNEIIVL
jgi:cellulose biosynthesis protein BcsQ